MCPAKRSTSLGKMRKFRIQGRDCGHLFILNSVQRHLWITQSSRKQALVSIQGSCTSWISAAFWAFLCAPLSVSVSLVSAAHAVGFYFLTRLGTVDEANQLAPLLASCFSSSSGCVWTHLKKLDTDEIPSALEKEEVKLQPDSSCCCREICSSEEKYRSSRGLRM